MSKYPSQQAVKAYQKAYRTYYGKSIAFIDAEKQGRQLLRLFQLIYKPLPKSKSFSVFDKP